MLGIAEVRRLIEDETLSDEEVAEIRDAFQILGEIIFEQWLSERKAPALQEEISSH